MIKNKNIYCTKSLSHRTTKKLTSVSRKVHICMPFVHFMLKEWRLPPIIPIMTISQGGSFQK